MKPLVRGEETDLVEIPASWYLDDLPPMMFIKTSPNRHGFVNPLTLLRPTRPTMVRRLSQFKPSFMGSLGRHARCGADLRPR